MTSLGHSELNYIKGGTYMILQGLTLIVPTCPRKVNVINTVRETNACQFECILSWASRKLTWVSEILYRTCKGHLFWGECPRNFVSHTAIYNGTMCVHLTHFSLDKCGNICISCYYHHQIGHMIH